MGVRCATSLVQFNGHRYVRRLEAAGSLGVWISPIYKTPMGRWLPFRSASVVRNSVGRKSPLTPVVHS